MRGRGGEDDALGWREEGEGRRGGMDELGGSRKGGEEGEGKGSTRGAGGGFYDELKMTLSCSLVSKDHSVC